jgi:hypothetical protein
VKSTGAFLKDLLRQDGATTPSTNNAKKKVSIDWSGRHEAIQRNDVGMTEPLERLNM